MRAARARNNACLGMSAMSKRKSRRAEPRHRAAFVITSSDVMSHITKIVPLEIPALGVGDQEVAENLYACNRFQLFRVDEVRIERERIFLAE
jgi:hypothetical protein